MKTPFRILLLVFLCNLLVKYTGAQPGWSSSTPLGHGATPRYNACAMSIGTKGYIGTGFFNSNFYSDFYEYDASLNSWSQKSTLTGGNRSGATSFSIGLKGYIGLGYDGLNYKNDFWEYDQASNSWSQKATFTGDPRSGAVGFSIGTKGYIGTGYTGSVRKADFWEYDQASNSWLQKANFGGVGRSAAAGFSIGTKGYLGTGYDGVVRKNDFWEYDQLTNTWTQKANFAGSARSNSVSFTIGSKGYITTGLDGTYKNDLWEYNPISNTWTAKANFGGAGRYNAVGFSFGTKAYVGTGFDGLTARYDFWEYDQLTNSWVQKAVFGGYARTGAVSFSMNNKGYMASGFDGNTYLNDLWEFDPSNNIWTQKAACPGAGRTGAVGFAINSKGYMATGFNGTYLNDLWEYDPISNTWLQKANFGGAARQEAIAFVVNAKAYVGTGTTGSSKNDFWEYDPLTNQWIQKAVFPGGVRQEACGFSVSSKGYLCAGIDNADVYYDDLWEYDPSLNSWLQLADFPNGARRGAAVISFDNKGYLCGGFDPLGFNDNDVWEYDPASTIWTRRADFPGNARNSAIFFNTNTESWLGFGDDGTISKNDLWKFKLGNSLTLPGSAFCAGTSFNITFASSNYVATGNLYTAELSDEFGTFNSPTVVGTLAGSISGSIAVTLPSSLTGSTNYKLRVICNSPNQILSTSIPFTINTSPVIISCPAPVTSFTAFNLCSAVVTYNAATATGFPTPSIIYSKNSGTVFQTGITNVIATVSNACNTVNCNFNVTVIDNQPPSITCPATVNANASPGQCSANGVSLGSPVVSDNCGVAGFTNNAPSSFPVGNTAVTWTVTDVNGNTNQCVQTVIVSDNQLPVITCPATVNVNAATGLCSASGVVLGTPSVSDNCGIANVTNNAPSAFPVGNTVVTWSAIDVNSNAKQCAQTVTVTDNQTPVITGCPANIISRNHSATWIPPVASDNCGIASFTSNYAPGAIFPNGISTVTYTATDVNGKISTCSFTVKTNQINYTIIASGPLTICKPGSIMLSAFPSGNFYQWFKNGNPISGATEINYSAATDGSYFCKVTDDFGSVNSNTLTVNSVSKPAAAITPSEAVTICEGQSILLSANTGAGLTYQWKKGTANINGATNSTYQVTQPGAYKVTVKNSTSCSKSSAATSVSVSCKEDIAVNEQINIKVFPNPNDGNFTVSYNTAGNNPSIIQVANLLGQVVYEKVSKDNNPISFNFNNEAAGIYFVRLKCDDRTVVKKIEIIR